MLVLDVAMSLRINDFQIDWENQDSHYFFNPKHPQLKQWLDFAKTLPFFPAHIYVFTSHLGRICILSKQAFLSSARAVNAHLQINHTDSYSLSLPMFHVAGLAISARAFVAQIPIHKAPEAWDAQTFHKSLQDQACSLCSLVPAQIQDLVLKNLKAPSCLRLVLVGGQALSSFIYKKARQLAWPVLLSYGLTEACSQVACSSLKSLTDYNTDLQILDHIQIQCKNNLAKIKSPSLLTSYFDLKSKKLYDPKDSKHWFTLPDKISLKNHTIFVHGRNSEDIKILGERVHLQTLSFLLEKIFYHIQGEHQLLALPDKRQGFKLTVVSDSFETAKLLEASRTFNSQVMPFEKIQALYFVKQIPKNHIFKIKQQQLQKILAL